MKIKRCENCGATLKSNVCEYCKTEYDTEDNISYGVEAKRYYPKRYYQSVEAERYYQSWINILTGEYREN